MTTPIGALDALKIDAEGRVGIGTPNPEALLDVNGTAKVSTLTFPDGTGDKISLSGQTGDHYGIGIQPGFLQIHTDNASSDIAFGHVTSDSFTETMRITGDGLLHVGGARSTLTVDTGKGSVGIGTPSPAYALDVPGGNARFKGLLLGDGSLLNSTSNGFLRFDEPHVVLNAAQTGNVYLGYDQGQDIHFGLQGAKMVLTSAGNLGIGTAPAHPLDVNGDAMVRNDLWVNGNLMFWDNGAHSNGNVGWVQVYNYNDSGWWVRAEQPSDLRLKGELQSISSALDKVHKLRGLTYRWNDEGLRYLARDIETTISAGPQATAEENQQLWHAEREKRYKTLANTQVGVVAQDVEAVLPEAVTTDQAGYKSVRYNDLIPLLIEAVKELDTTVEDQSQLVAQQQEEIARLRASHLVAQQQLAELAAVKAHVAELAATVQRISGDSPFGQSSAALQ